MEIACIGPSAEACPQTVAAIVGIVRRVAVSIFHLLMGCGTVETALLLIGFRRSPLIVSGWDRSPQTPDEPGESTMSRASFQFPARLADEVRAHAARLDRSFGWILATAAHCRATIAAMVCAAGRRQNDP